MFILATNALNSDGATDVLDVISCLNQHVTLHTDAVGSVPFGKGFHKGVAVLQLDHVTRPPLLGEREVNGYISRVSN